MLVRKEGAAGSKLVELRLPEVALVVIAGQVRLEMVIIPRVPETLAIRLIKDILVEYFRWGMRHESGIIKYAGPGAVFFIIADVAVREPGAQPVNAVSS